MPRTLLLTLVLLLTTFSPAVADDWSHVGVARRDITPDYPVRLTGYGNRKDEATEVEQRLWAKALAIGAGDEAAVLVTVDNLGISAAHTTEVARRLQEKFGLRRERFVVCASHTHTAPYLPSVAPTIFEPPLPAEHMEHSRRYERELVDHLTQVSAAALEARAKGRITWTQGTATFAANRRSLRDGKWTGFGVVPTGPVDHALPVLRVTDEAGKVRTVLVNYACHCTTLGGRFNKLCGDWAGYAQEFIERDHPGAIAMIAIGCGADANPEPRDKDDAVALCKRHGEAIAAEVKRLATSDWTPVTGSPRCALKQIKLPFDKLPTRAEFEQRTQQRGPISWHARVNLARLDRGEKLPTELDYPVQVWKFDQGPTMVFLAGEVVVDYVLRLKRELNSDRLWVTAYANDDPCYIASKRVIAEGGYEVDSSMYYYDRPTRFAPEVEDRIVETVLGMLK